MLEKFDRLCETYKGDLTELQRGIGMYFVGRRLGWKVLFIMHDKKTIKKDEGILKVEFKKEFEPFEDQAKRTNIYKVLKKIRTIV